MIMPEVMTAVADAGSTIITKELPPVNFSHIRSLTDDTGIIQHALFGIPNRKEGYCIDDNSRALLLAVWADKGNENIIASQVMPVYLSFIHYMQTEEGEFRNFMSYIKHCPEDRGSEDSFGRTLMALGYLANEGTSKLMIRTGAEIFEKAYPHVSKLNSIRGIANSIIGICQFIHYNYPDDLKIQMVVDLADRMLLMYQKNRSEEWRWFEPVLTYDNAILPLALLHAYEISLRNEYLNVAFEAIHFLESKVMYNGMIHPVGNIGWCQRSEQPARFDQQGIDVMAMILFYQQAYKLTLEQKNLRRLYTCFQWFHGLNDLGLSLYDPITGGCADGLHADGINFNQGAESTLAYWISHFALMSAFKE